MPRSRRRHEESAEETLARVTVRLEAYRDIARQQGGRADIGVDHVLDLLDPAGTWRFDRAAGSVGEPAPAAEDRAGLDPLTGCKPVI
jgi:hypothetical protein